MKTFEPAYLRSYRNGTLRQKAEAAESLLHCCTLCPRQCGANRLSGETGHCKTANKAVVAGYNAHFGEEKPLSGHKGSGTIFFTHCNLLCNFCQNYDISHKGCGTEVSNRKIADMMLHLQKMGCHNINFVTPSHVVPQILSAVLLAAETGLTIPLVYNSGGYDLTPTLRLLENVIDIYMPDFKFWDKHLAKQTCGAGDYPDVVRSAIVEMHRQVGDLIIDDRGLAKSGLLVRHLVLPHGLAGTPEIMAFLANHVSSYTYVNIMPQYRPCGQATDIDALSRSITQSEYAQALDQAKMAGITRLDERGRAFSVVL